MLDKIEKAILYITCCDYISYKNQSSIINNVNIANIFDAFGTFCKDVTKILNVNELDRLKDQYDIDKFNMYINNLEKFNISVVTLASENYPKLLKEIDTPPLVLYAKGDTNLLNKESVAIVGSRRSSRYGKEVTERFSSILSKSGLVIVSGLADGIDTFAHSACLEAKGKTIAVLGGGINEIYPATNTNLANSIVENGGLLVSEYKPNDKPQTFHFPVRNRIIAGLSKVVIITEATEKSGSMHTKNYALEYGRDVYAVPGRITDSYSSGCNKIIKNCQSSIALDPNDILEALGKEPNKIKQNFIQYSLTDKLILDIIDVNEIHYEEILQKSGLDSKELNTMLIRLELKGLIKKLPGNFYSK